MVDRDYILKRIKSRPLTVGEFNFDKLQAPPLIMLLRPWEIQELEQIATSIRLSAQLKKKYALIDGILRPRGFKKFINGTNRVCYEYIEDKSFMLKVGIDAVGIKDSPWEYKNQFIFKPFIPKVFEVSPGGAVGLFERVNPITNEEEFRAVAEDIYTVINEVFVGEYVLADIGTKFFMNWGIREGFGPVLLDFPYVYKLDGKKLFCNAFDPNSETGVCNGPIDYDSGYNFLVCTRCGKHYKASDLRTDGETRKIIIREKGGYKMKVSISGGTKEISKTIKVNEDGRFSEVTDVMPITKTVVETAPKIDKKEEVKQEPKEEIVRPAAPIINEVKEEPAKATMSVNGNVTPNVKKEAKPGVVSPITFISEEEKMKTMEKILDHVNQIRSLLYMLNNDEVLDLSEILFDLITECENRGKSKASVTEYIKSVKKAAMMLDKFNEKEAEEALSDEFTAEIVKAYNEHFEGDSEEEEEPVLTAPEPTPEEDKKDTKYTFALANAVVENMKDIDPEQPSKKILVLLDNDENFIVTSNNEIMGIDTVDNRPIDSISIVSKEWLDSVQALLDSKETAEESEDEEDDEIVGIVEGEE